MAWLDWLIVVIPLLIVAGIGIYTQRYVKGVADFLTGGRVAGRYLLTVAAGEAGMGLISVIAVFEMLYHSGFAIGFWQILTFPVGMIIALTGFVAYRFRETRAMTLAQFLEIRYSRRFRVFAGLLCYVSGVLNYAIFPAVGARFLLHYGGLPQVMALGGLHISTFALLMAAALAVALVVVLTGGQITTMVTDCAQGLFSYVVYAILVAAILMLFDWGQIAEALSNQPPGKSLLNPLDMSGMTDFNVFFILSGIFANFYSAGSWQGTAAYNAAALNAHEQKMARILGTWRTGLGGLVVVLLAVAAYTFMNHPDFAAGAQQVRDELTTRIHLDNPATTETIRNQMLVPVAIKHFLPIGVTGAFYALMVFLMVSTDTTYLHSWGSILVQDVVLPFRKKPFTPRQQIWLLRLSIAAVAVFAFFFSFFFSQVQYILMFFSLTGAIYMGGAGAVILGGLYWKRGTAAGAWSAMIVGTGLAGASFLLQGYWERPIYPWLLQHAPGLLDAFRTSLEGLSRALPFVAWEWSPTRFPITGRELAFLTMITSLASYMGVSLATCRRPFNIQRMLHRGEYRRLLPPEEQRETKILTGWRAILSIDKRFNRWDRLVAWAALGWTLLQLAFFFVAMLWNMLISRWSNSAWADFFLWTNVILLIVVGVITTIWFFIGTVIDLRKFVQRLKLLQRNVLDDGRVVDHQSVADAVAEAVPSDPQQAEEGPLDG
ncbi:MAG TPA: hypothetical protein DCX07_15780 [Phycisphaerales bacterium]|nr:hypothetical protein [Phycisphaerales bacterium]